MTETFQRLFPEDVIKLRAEGRELGKEAAVIGLLQAGKISLQAGADFLGIPVEEMQAKLDDAKKKA